MNPKQFEDIFQKVKQEANLVQALRTLIFKLATNGKLTDKEIAKTEVKNLGSCVELIMGQAPRGESCNSDGNGTMFVKVGEFGSLFPQEINWTTEPKKHAKSGDVLICVVGATIGKLNLGVDCAIGRSVAAIRPDPILDSKFLYYSLQPYSLSLRENAQGTAQGVIGKKDLNAIEIWLPPLEEQNRIVAKVDELMALCDELENKSDNLYLLENQYEKSVHSRTRPSKENAFQTTIDWSIHTTDVGYLTKRKTSVSGLRSTIISLGIWGHLSKRTPHKYGAQELIEEIADKRIRYFGTGQLSATEVKTQRNKQQKQTIPTDMVGLPLGWTWATLMQCCLLVIDCKNKTAPYASDGIRLVRTTNIKNGALNYNEPKFVTEATYELWSLRSKPEPGDILITREAPMGEVCKIPEGEKICLGQRIMLARVVPDTIDSDFLRYSLMDPNLMDRVQDKPVGMTVQHLRVGGVESLLVPVPPLREQKEIVTVLNQLMNICDQLENSLKKEDAIKADLLKTLVA